MTTDSRAGARELRQQLIRNMEGRKGFRRDGVDDETNAEWDEEWDDLIACALADARRAGMEEAMGTIMTRLNNMHYVDACDAILKIQQELYQ